MINPACASTSFGVIRKFWRCMALRVSQTEEKARENTHKATKREFGKPTQHGPYLILSMFPFRRRIWQQTAGQRLQLGGEEAVEVVRLTATCCKVFPKSVSINFYVMTRHGRVVGQRYVIIRTPAFAAIRFPQLLPRYRPTRLFDRQRCKKLETGPPQADFIGWPTS